MISASEARKILNKIDEDLNLIDIKIKEAISKGLTEIEFPLDSENEVKNFEIIKILRNLDYNLKTSEKIENGTFNLTISWK